jgi:hypothetical protein
VGILRKIWPGFPIADENHQIAEVFVVDDWNDPDFAAFALLDNHSFALNIEVTDIELDEFAATNAQPLQRFDQTAISKIGRCQQ